MRNLKKFLALVLAMVMAFSLMITANAAIDLKDDNINDTYYDAVALLDAMGVFTGDEDGFRPTDNITRGEVAAVIYRIATGESKAPDLYKDYNWFSDVHESEWFAPYVNFCANAEYIKGDRGYFNPYDNITGYEVLAMVLRVVGYDQNHEFEGSTWTIQTARIARQEGVTKNIAEGTLGSYATRQVVAEMIYQAIQIPTVSYTFLQNYQKDILVEKTADDKGRWIYPENVYNTLLYANYSVVGRRTVLGADDFGRPVVQWVRDNSGDTTSNGGKYIVNIQGNTTPLKDSNAPSNGATYDDPNEDASFDGRLVDGTAFSYVMKPVKTYYTEITECQIAQDVNKGNSMTGVHEWWNGKPVYYGGTVAGGDLVATRMLDKLHTTTDKVGAQGRTTEIYKIPANTFNGAPSWEIVYIDTLLAEVTDVTARTFDTLGHVYHPATLTIRLNSKGTNAGETIITAAQTGADYTYKKGDLVLVNVWDDIPMNIGAVATADDTPAASRDNLAKLQWVPAQAWTDTTVTEDVDDAAEGDQDIGNHSIRGIAGTYANATIVGAPTSKQITVNGTVGAAQDKTGVVGTDNATYLSSNVFHAEAGVIATPDHTTNKGTYVPAGYAIKTTNNLIRRTFDLYLDARGNVTGMKEVTAGSNIGVITALEPVRVGIGRWVMEAKVFKADNTEETIRLLTDTDPSGVHSYDYVSSGDTNVEAADDNTAGLNNLIKYAPVTKDGTTYAYVVEVGAIDTDNTAPATATGVMVQTGVADTLRGATYTDAVLDDTTPFIIASTTFDYSLRPNENVGNRVLGSLRGYTGFKTIPTIMGADNSVKMAEIDGTYYIYPDVNGSLVPTDDGSTYSFAAQPTINVDKTYLVLATVATYADHAEYRVLENGTETVLKVANINDNRPDAGDPKGLNQLVEEAKAAGELIRVTGMDLSGNATAITFVEQTENLGKCDNGSGALTALTQLKDSVLKVGAEKTTTIASTVFVSYADGVLTLADAAVSPTTVEYLTVDANCKVQIVNTVLGTYYEGTLASVNQYRTTTPTTPVHEIVYEVNNLGYVCNIYIMD